MWAIAGGEATVTAWPENVSSTIFYAFKIRGGKKKEKLISESLPLQSKQNMAPLLCHALCIIKLMLQLQQHVGYTAPFHERLRAESSTELECACSGREMMLNGNEECLGCCEGLFPFCSYRREMCAPCPFNRCGSHEAEECFSPVQERMQRALGLEGRDRVTAVIVSYKENICRDDTIIWVHLLSEVNVGPGLFNMCLLNNIRFFLALEWHHSEMGWSENIFLLKKKKTENVLGTEWWSILGQVIPARYSYFSNNMTTEKLLKCHHSHVNHAPRKFYSDASGLCRTMHFRVIEKHYCEFLESHSELTVISAQQCSFSNNTGHLQKHQEVVRW